MNSTIDIAYEDLVRDVAYPWGKLAWVVTCGECKKRSELYDNNERSRADFARPWLVDSSKEKAQATLDRHNRLHH